MKTIIGVIWATVGLTLAGTAETSAVPTIPPPPSMHGLTPAQREAAKAAYEKSASAWYNALTPEQRAAVKKAYEDDDLARVNAKLDLQNLGDYDWHNAAKGWSLDPVEIAQLERTKVAIGDREEKQAFQLYNARPVFITSDSLLNAYHALMEDSLGVVERQRVGFLRQRFETALKDARTFAASAASGELQPALIHLQRVLGPALLLLGTPDSVFDQELRAELHELVAHIRQADGLSLPAWLAPADAQCAALDFGRCKPTGLYADDPRLADYFRAVRWLQMVPFRSTHPPELAAVGLLSLAGYWEDSRLVFDAYTKLIGREDGLALTTDENFARMAASWTEIQGRTKTPPNLKMVSTLAAEVLTNMGRYRPAQVNDGVRGPMQPGESPVAHMLPAAATPDALVFAQTTSQNRPLPSGLEVTAMLGSDFARRNLPGTEAEKNFVLATINRVAPSVLEPTRDRTLYLGGQYYHTLAALFLPADPAAPDFMRSEAWAAKSCQTALAGWAQERHTWTLQAKTNVVYLGIQELPSGFVEPNPEFFSRMIDLLGESISALDTLQAFTADPDEQIEALRRDADLFERLGITTLGADKSKVSADDFARVESAEELLFKAGMRDLRPPALRLREMADQMAAGAPAPTTSFGKNPDLRGRWMNLNGLVGHLAVMVQKQLRGIDWNNEEASLIRTYKNALAEAHGYYGDTWETPRDDAPRWVEIASNPKTGEILGAAIGRPRALYVLYPWHGKDMLCVGAVMPYFEVKDNARLTDREWKAKLDAETPPKLPIWLQAVAPP